MDFNYYFGECSNEKPLDNMVSNGGMCSIFRKIACIGDSLSSGEMESLKDGKPHYHDYYDYSWGQFLARDAGCTVYNFSCSGMTAKRYCENFADSKDFWNIDYRSQAYILALGVNDVTDIMDGNLKLGTAADIDIDDYKNNKETFAGYCGQIIQRYMEIQPKAKFFLFTIPSGIEGEERESWYDKHAALMYEIADLFDSCYVLDFRKYAPVYDEKFKEHFWLAGHLNAAGYRLTALMTESYIDYIIRHNHDDFRQIAFVGTPYHNEGENW